MRQRGFSTIFIIIILTIIAIGAFYYLRPAANQSDAKAKSTPSPLLNNNEERKYTPIGECSSESCLFEGGIDNVPEGYAKISGYYISYEADDWGTPTKCDGFIVTDGNETLINHFQAWIKQGNTLNKMINNKLVVNISLSNIDSDLQKRIKLSTKDQQVELGMLRVTPQGRGASTCSSVINILTAKSITD